MPEVAKAVKTEAAPAVNPTIKMYTQKGTRLVWLTKKQLPATIKPGDRYDATIEKNTLTIKFSESGKNKVYSKKTTDGADPVVAIKGKQLSDAFGLDKDGIIEHIPVKINGKTMVIAR
jgi:hypothetical protein